MKKERKTASIWTHIVVGALSVAGGITSGYFDYGWKSFFLGFSLVAIFALIIFLIFAVPFERGWITQKSFLWKCLNWYNDNEDDSVVIVNLCELPGMIGVSVAWGISFILYCCCYVICIIIGNIVMPILFGKYVKPDYDDIDVSICDLPMFPEIYIGGDDGLRFRPWMFVVSGGILWVLFAIGKWLHSLTIVSTANATNFIWIGLFCFVGGVIWLMIKYEFFDSIWSLILSIEKKVCFIRKIPEK